VQEAWLRASRAGGDGVDNLGGWLTTIVARVCLNVLRSRRAHPEEPLDVHVPDPVVARENDPEQAALLGDAVGLALLVVLETLTPAERVAFVLHDTFAVPFADVARLLAAEVAGKVLQFANPAAQLHPVVVNGGAGVLITLGGEPFSLVAFTVVDGRIAQIDSIADPERVPALVSAVL
jgi:hypothetical protein